jgi:hypothetical protein
MNQSRTLLAAAVAAILLAGCEQDEGRLARIRAAEASAWAEVIAAEAALRAFDNGDRLEVLEARHEAELLRIEARQVSIEELPAWEAMMDSLRTEIGIIRTAPLNLDEPTQDTLLVRLRSEYYGARDRWTLSRLAIGFVDGQ